MRGFFLLSGLALWIGIAIWHNLPPNPTSVTAPQAQFSVSRAMLHVQQIAQQPHPVDTPENAKVRQYLLDQLKQLGYQPELQMQVVTLPKQQRVVNVNNVLVRISGKKSSKALLLIAHYDSVKTGPGAADNAASVSAILETLRAIKQLPQLDNDLICLFSDGEEVGLLGAHAFIQQHAWVRDVGLALNFEYRGNRGPFLMFQTSNANGKLIEGLAQAAPFVLTSSLMAQVYEQLPNDTDLTPFLAANIPGMNFAAIAGQQYYHTDLDRPEYLNQGSLQHEVNIMLALVDYFGKQNLADLNAEKRIYFDFPGLGVVHYSLHWSVFWCVVVVVLFAALLISAYQAKAVRSWAIIAVLLAFPVLLTLMYLLNDFIRYAIYTSISDVNRIAAFDNASSFCLLVSVMWLNLALLGSVYFVAKKWLRTGELSLGVAGFWLSVLVFLTYAEHGASFLLLWPLFNLLVALYVLKIPDIAKQPRLRISTLLAGSLSGVMLFTLLIINAFIALTPHGMSLVLVLFNLIIGLLIPVICEITAAKQGIIVSAILSGVTFLLSLNLV